MNIPPMSGSEAISAVATGASSASDVVADCLAKVHQIDGLIGAFRIIDEQMVRSHAKELDDQGPAPLRGLVVGVKDVIDTADLPTGYGSPLFEGHRPSADAAVVTALRGGGAVVLGKTESTEFAMFQPARTRNPVDPRRTPGGSSSGSAAAVAAGMVPVALGTQTAGSVVRPAAYCGVYGFKPSKGWAPTEGIWLLSGQLDTVGLFARCAADLTVIYRALAKPAAGTLAGDPPGFPPRSLRAGRSVLVLRATEWADCEPEVGDALDFAAGRLCDAGWEVRDIRMPDAWRHLPDQHNVVMAAEVAKNLRTALGRRISQISDSAQAVVEQGDQCSARDYLHALEARDRARALLAPLSVAGDLLLTPSAPGAAPEGLAYTGDPVMCRPWTLLGLPAANIPAYRRPDGLPVGVQLVGLAGNDLAFLADLASAEAAISQKE
jgi:Asp-tRNA(Asn)/Glu-tRNA(Gln) amidotransferase A subunit family amidase